MNKLKITNIILKWQRYSLLLTLTSLFFLPHANASSVHEDVEKGAEEYLLAALRHDDADTNIGINIVKIDNRINIPTCHEGFQYHASEESLQQSYVSVRVSCNDNDWYLFTSAHVVRTRKIVVVSGAVSPGTVLTASNLAFSDVDVRRLRHSTFTSVDTLIGARIKRRITDGQPVQANMLCFVCEGDRITITAAIGGMSVKTSGIAQQDGVIGDPIKVLNTSSKKTVIAEVASVQEVVIHL